ncbi:tRNA (guanosine(18)-2'-O)-methyltransferase TrmH [Hahella ganghwensis]|uniref:tRNA (guanosine(18)-2'-O)-methyltransferase TrmH n=1 Tax=Hahella ganghwensis TaxID=286420 RepID=UPI00037ACD15|nr:tRNA (guanosine(18)-2'-O)-methyltransferase TrmH [Hahella ganghwensis]
MINPSRFHKFRQVLDQRQPDLRVIAEKVHKPHNIAAVMRSADAVGVAHLHMVWPWEHDRFPKGTSKGSERYVELHRHADTAEPVQKLKSQGYRVYAAHFSERAVDYRKLDYVEPCALLVGAEKHGVSQEAADLADEHVIIPMRGMVASFNVSVAAAIILEEAHRQRDIAGYYNQQRLSSEEYHWFLFRWTHPVFAAKCDLIGEAYPPMDEAGAVLAPPEWWERMRQIVAGSV